MKLQINSRAILTDENSSSSYGIPVLLIEGKSHGPADEGVLGDDPMSSLLGPSPLGDQVAIWSLEDERTEEELKAADLFCKQNPKGVQVFGEYACEKRQKNKEEAILQARRNNPQFEIDRERMEEAVEKILPLREKIRKELISVEDDSLRKEELIWMNFGIEKYIEGIKKSFNEKYYST